MKGYKILIVANVQLSDSESKKLKVLAKSEEESKGMILIS